EAAISAQQLLYTVIAAAPKIDALQLQIGGVPVTSLWGTPLGAATSSSPPASATATAPGTITALPTWQVWGHVWITAPLESATVASSFQIGGEASVFEGAVHWQILRNGGLLKEGTAQATVGAPDRGTWSVTVEGVTPGPYQIRAYEVSAKDGSITFEDDKLITVS